MQEEKHDSNVMKIARGLGWFSLGLGVVEMVAPRAVTRCCGFQQHNTLLRLIGLREVASGIGILSRRKPAWGMWSRVAGDAMTLALLGTALTQPSTRRGRVAAAAAAVAGAAALDYWCARQLSGRDGVRGIHFEKSIIIHRPPEEVFAFWRNLENLPRFMDHLESVQELDQRRSHWVAKGPAGSHVEWDAEIINEKANEMIAWRSLEGADVDSSGTVRFEHAAGGRGTLVKVNMVYDPPAGVLGAKVAWLFGQSPEKQVQVDLHRFKQLLETGEVARTSGQPSGRSPGSFARYEELPRS